MDKISIIFSKLGGLQTNLKGIDWTGTSRIFGYRVEHLFSQYDKLRKELIDAVPELYSDMPVIALPIPTLKSKENNFNVCTQNQILPIIDNIDYMLEVRASFRIGQKTEEKEKPKRIFISHGRSNEWYKVQAFIEKDLELTTLELEQEASLGRTVLQKLNEESDRCGFAVIVMTGDDFLEGQVRARENVMHEIGFFQGKYGLHNVTLLHEEAVNIPSNIHGLVYISFPKDAVSASFAGLQREIKAQVL